MSGSMSFLGVVQETPCAVRVACDSSRLPMALNTHSSAPSTEGKFSIMRDSCEEGIMSRLEVTSAITKHNSHYTFIGMLGY